MNARTLAFLPILLVLVVGLAACGGADEAGPVEEVTVAAGKSAVLVYVAQDQGFFQENGLDVEIEDYDAGKLAADALLAGEADIATAAEAVLVSNSFDHDDVRGWAVIAGYQIQELIARKDRGIDEIADIKDKKLGVTRKSAAEFALGRFLTLNHLSFQDVEIVDLTPAEIVDAMGSGDIDAALTWEPHIYTLKQALGTTAISWPADSGQDTCFVLISKDAWLKAHPSAAERFLRALSQAETYVEDNDAEVRKFLQERFDYDPDYLQSVWPKYEYSVSLPQALLGTLEDQARWRIENGLTDDTDVPNFLDFLYLDALEATKPEAVTIIR
jgi:NitT/TauT family transport system substrate-binding protein